MFSWSRETTQREIFVSSLFELIIQVTVLWRRKRKENMLLLLTPNILWHLVQLYIKTHLILHQPLLWSGHLLCWAPGRQGRSWRQTCWMSHSVQPHMSNSLERPFVLRLPCHDSWGCGHWMLLAPTEQCICIVNIKKKTSAVNLTNIGSHKMTNINTISNVTAKYISLY